MDKLSFHTQELPEMEEAGARYVVVAHYGEWRDGMATNNRADIPRLQRELRKRFMKRIGNKGVPRKAGTAIASSPPRHYV